MFRLPPLRQRGPPAAIKNTIMSTSMAQARTTHRISSIKRRFIHNNNLDHPEQMSRSTPTRQIPVRSKRVPLTASAPWALLKQPKIQETIECSKTRTTSEERAKSKRAKRRRKLQEWQSRRQRATAYPEKAIDMTGGQTQGIGKCGWKAVNRSSTP